MKVVIAMDSFKGSADTQSIGAAVAAGVHQADPNAQTQVYPIADGGEGTLAAMREFIGGTVKKVAIVDDFNQNRLAQYLLTDLAGQRLAIIEAAQAVSLSFSDTKTAEERYQASSFGLGQLILDALTSGASQLIVTLGGSGTTDGGLGLLQALGATVYDDQDNVIPHGVNPLINFAKFELNNARQLLAKVDLILAPDVSAPLSGKQGAALFFGAQKGLDPKQMKHLNQKLILLGAQAQQDLNTDIANLPGAGAAGGLGFGLYLLGGRYEQNGFHTLADLAGITAAVQGADLVITGEGRMDTQTSLGKVPQGMADIANHYHKPIIALVGQRAADLGALGDQFAGVFAIQLAPGTLLAAMNKANTLLGVQVLAREIVKFYQSIYK
ncbi:glxK protein [Agrilactobacillus composti DSM 18527 = JCM 14202]|uniref:GlxK protein n=1 Tax=Agrilactobacillus composti DSM 18527 = JCM 14202 TaxID=1423734 RepID=A0A0R1XXI6_9LACO|nr:glycerate kinase [Agrilactobacillus composti]KRM34872.1 glxK protein [Agrilactobacillus composti DSM 18527 = JCM 14202]